MTERPERAVFSYEKPDPARTGCRNAVTDGYAAASDFICPMSSLIFLLMKGT